MDVLCAEVMASASALKQVKNPLTLGRQALTSAMEVLAKVAGDSQGAEEGTCLLYTSPSPRD